MKNVQIIGVGQLGSRHLQALRAVRQPLNITAVDASVESLKVAEERFNAVPALAEHKFTASTEVKGCQDGWDLVIVATNSNVRRSVVEKLLSLGKVRHLVLEKILFANAKDYVGFNSLVSNAGTKAWVNCCMRQMPIYRKIKTEVNHRPHVFTVQGSQFGLVTNAIHYIDYMAWLAGSTRFKLDVSMLDPKPIASKRMGYLELNGSLGVRFENGNAGLITCFGDGSLPIQVQVHADDRRYIVRESEGKAWVFDKANNWVASEIDARIPYQSQMTTEVAESIFSSGECPLTPLAESIEIHNHMLQPLADFLGKIGVDNPNGYPFT